MQWCEFETTADDGSSVRIVDVEGLDLLAEPSSPDREPADHHERSVDLRPRGRCRRHRAAARCRHVVDPVRAVVAIQNYLRGTSEIAQTRLCSILGQVELDDLLVKRDEINSQLQAIIDGVTASLRSASGVPNPDSGWQVSL